MMIEEEISITNEINWDDISKILNRINQNREDWEEQYTTNISANVFNPAEVLHDKYF